MAIPSTLRGKPGRIQPCDEITLVKLLPDAQAVVSIKGLCRIVAQPSGRVIWEFIDREHAHRIVALQQCALADERAEAIDYETGKVLNFDCRGLSDDPVERSYQVWYFPSREHANEDSTKHYRKVYRRAKGFKLGRLLPGPAKKRLEDVKLFKPANDPRRPFRSESKQRAS